MIEEIHRTIIDSNYLVKDGETAWDWANRIRVIKDDEYKEVSNFLGLAFWSFENWWLNDLDAPKPRIHLLSKNVKKLYDDEVIGLVWKIYKNNNFYDDEDEIHDILLTQLIEAHNKFLMETKA